MGSLAVQKTHCMHTFADGAIQITRTNHVEDGVEQEVNHRWCTYSVNLRVITGSSCPYFFCLRLLCIVTVVTSQYTSQSMLLTHVPKDSCQQLEKFQQQLKLRHLTNEGVSDTTHTKIDKVVKRLKRHCTAEAVSNGQHGFVNCGNSIHVFQQLQQKKFTPC